LTLLNILMRFPVRGEEPIGGSPQGQQLNMWGPWGGSESPQGICRSKERCRGRRWGYDYKAIWIYI